MYFPYSFWTNPFADLNNPNYLIGFWHLDEAGTSLRVNSVIQNSGYSLIPLDNTNASAAVLTRPGKFVNSAYFESFLSEQPLYTNLLYSGQQSGLTVGNDSFTLTCWTCPSGLPGTENSFVTDSSIKGFDLIDKQDVSLHTLEYMLARNDSDIPFAWFGGFEEAGAGKLARVRVSGNTALPKDTFSFLALSYDKVAQKLFLYCGINNNLNKFSANTTGAYENNLSVNSFFSIGGGHAGGFGAPAGALIDEVGFWRKSLSIDEIKIIYNSATGQNYPFSSNRVWIPG